MGKSCTVCNLVKDENDFGYQKRGDKQYIRSACRACRNITSKQHYRSSEYRRNQLREITRVKLRRSNKLIFEFLAENPCGVCGEKDPIVLEFHHKDRGTKIASIGNLKLYSEEKLRAEMDKCEILCANCHRRETAKQFGWGKLEFA